MKRSALIAIIAVILTLIGLGVANYLWPTVPAGSIAGVVALGSVVVAAIGVFLFGKKK